MSTSLNLLDFREQCFFGDLNFPSLYHFLLKNLKFLKLFCQKCLNVLDFVEQHFVGHLCFISFSFTSEIFFKKSAILSKSLNLLVFVEQRFCRPPLFLSHFFFFRNSFKKISNFVKIFKSFGFCRAAFLSATSLSAPGVVYQGSHFMFYNPTNYKQ